MPEVRRAGVCGAAVERREASGASPDPRRSHVQRRKRVVEVTARGTTNGNARGSSRDRLRRRLWLLKTYGDGERAPCHYCRVELDVDTITVDRIIPGCQVGTYRRGNIQPTCPLCNPREGGRLRSGRQREVAAGQTRSAPRQPRTRADAVLPLSAEPGKENDEARTVRHCGNHG